MALALAVLSIAASAQAQVVLDGTLRPGNAGSVPYFPGVDEYVVDDSIGIVAEKNLFHSFEQLSLGVGETLRFTGSAAIENLVARVTGGAASIIEGVIRSDLPNANLFLMNPAGLRFVGVESGARDPVVTPRSFFASTADALQFSDGRVFAALGGEDVSLLVATPSAWGFDGGGIGSIEVSRARFLQVDEGETLSLVASDITVTDGSTLQAPGGRVDLAALGRADAVVPLGLDAFSVVGLDPDALGGIRIDAGVESGSSLRTGTDVIGRADDPLGRVVIRGGSLQVLEASSIVSSGQAVVGTPAIDIEVAGAVNLTGIATLASSSTEAEGPGGIRIVAERVAIDGPLAEVSVEGLDGAAPGTLEVRATEIEVANGGSLITTAFGSQAGADIDLQAQRLVVRDGALVETSTRGSGTSGAMHVALLDPDESLRLTGGGQLGSVTTGAGAGGDVDVVAAGSILLEGEGERAGTTVPSLLFSRSGRGPGGLAAGGDAGRLDVTARAVSLTGPSAISTRAFGEGRSGVVTIDAAESILLEGTAEGAPEISARTVDGDGGGVLEGEPGLVLRTAQLELRDGAAVSTSSSGRGRGADVRVEADAVVVSSAAGHATAGFFSEALATGGGAFAPGDGDTGAIELRVGRIDLLAGGEISIETQGPGAGQSISVSARDSIRIAGGTIRSNAAPLATASAGDIGLASNGDVTISQGSTLTSESESLFLGSGADAGEIAVAAGGALTIEAAEVRARAENAAGGRIDLSSADRITLRDARVETSVLGSLTDGDAGNIRLAAPVIVLDESTVLSRAVLGDGGDIDLLADVLAASAGPPPDASSELGVSGQVTTTAPDTDLLRSLDRLPDRFADASALLGTRCASRERAQGSLVLGDREALPDSPARPLAIRLPLGSPRVARLAPDGAKGAARDGAAAPLGAPFDPCTGGRVREESDRR